MRILFILIVVMAASALVAFRSRWQKPKQMISMQPMSFYDLSINSLEGERINFTDFKGKYVLCVNVASKCGYTPQYEDLQKLSETYKDKLIVIGFPCNQFMGQEPGSAEEIQNFCSKNYGVTFQITEKIDVKGKGQHPVYQWLTMKQINGISDASISWNFNKILISPEGTWMHHFASGVKPLSEELTNFIR
jgi:glutathione peroxidase